MTQALLDTMGSVSSASEESRVVAGRYRLRSVLGSGSMGTVWSAYDEFLRRPVAVKEILLPPGVTTAQADELRERTLREARAIAVLSHPNVIVLHDVARENGEPFVVMELLPSHSLTELLREHGPLNAEQAAAVGDAVAAALEAAHDAGITHRDVKPGNVLVAEDGRIKLTDFGIARNVSEATMTRTGMTLGSPSYIAPEVASGRAVTPAADLWGLGATLFHLVEGRPPYDADGDPLATVGKVVKGEVPRPSPGPLAPVITGLMAKAPLDRMPLREVRQRLYPLITQAPSVLFGPEMFRQASGWRAEATDTREMASAPAQPPIAATLAGSRDALAADPGPLPFEPAPGPVADPAPPGRSRTATAVLTGAAILLFVVSAVGGFAAARAIGGQPPLTPPSHAAPSVPQEPPTKFERQEGNAPSTRGQDARFTVEVPADWQKFTTSQSGDNLPPSTLVQWVSPDGAQVLAVDHIADYPSTYSPDFYLSTGPSHLDGFEVVDRALLPKEQGDGLTITYRTLVTGNGTQQSRTTFAKIVKSGTDLWAVSVTVPTAQEDIARTALYQRMVPTFTVG
ncbi:serine/threonine protein kinase [Amycolatopsis taiwanensis]|uniref:non-specific serine/threonine protein kinase n=2 Tax=Amycolatopsis taiwanensis TaxID=342230 RepID=A0A9W6VIH7_9PSEU|nr:serine/threonine protein kinase [Amycolatopsis taiwanensis]